MHKKICLTHKCTLSNPHPKFCCFKSFFNLLENLEKWRLVLVVGGGGGLVFVSVCVCVWGVFDSFSGWWRG